MHINGMCAHGACRTWKAILDFFVAWSRYLRYNGADNNFLIGGMR